MNASMIIVSIVVALFAAFAGALVGAQQHSRSMNPAPAKILRRKRRPF
jgi:hypothetical protein